MALNVQYTDTFEYTFKALVEFIRDNWGNKVTDDFIKEADKTIQLISAFPNMYKPSSFDDNVRVAQVRKLSSLFYAVSKDKLTLLYRLSISLSRACPEPVSGRA